MLRTIYADIVFAVNFFIDYLILWMSFSFLNIKVKLVNILFAAILGGLIAVLAAIFYSHSLLKIVFCIVGLMCMLYMCVGKKRMKIYTKLFAMVYMFSMVLGGVVCMLFGMNNLSNSLCALITAAAVMFLSFRAYVYVFKRSIINRYIDAVVKIEGCEYKVNLLCDSGNLLIDPYTYLPIIVLKKSALKLDGLSLKTRLVPVETITGGGLISVLTPESIVLIDGEQQIHIKAVVGFSETEFSRCDCCVGIIPISLTQNI